jgi:hypothetical protein
MRRMKKARPSFEEFSTTILLALLRNDLLFQNEI